MHPVVLLIACVVLASVRTFTLAADMGGTVRGAEPQKILMIGNSLTFTRGIPAILEHFATATNRTLKITAHVTAGMTLTWHWNYPQVLAKTSNEDTVTLKRNGTTVKPDMPRGLTAKEEIAKAGFDMVILQELSPVLAAKPGQDEFNRVVPDYVKAIKGALMQPLLYMAHPTGPEVDPKRFNVIVDAYSKAAEELGIACAPVALAFVRCNEKHPNLALLDPQIDRKYGTHTMGTHPSPFGSYLAACTLYAAIYNQSPVGIGFHSAFKTFNSFNGAASSEFPIEAADATTAQQIAWDVWQEYVRKHPNRLPASVTGH